MGLLMQLILYYQDRIVIRLIVESAFMVRQALPERFTLVLGFDTRMTGPQLTTMLDELAVEHFEDAELVDPFFATNLFAGLISPTTLFLVYLRIL